MNSKTWIDDWMKVHECAFECETTLLINNQIKQLFSCSAAIMEAHYLKGKRQSLLFEDVSPIVSPILFCHLDVLVEYQHIERVFTYLQTLPDIQLNKTTQSLKMHEFNCLAGLFISGIGNIEELSQSVFETMIAVHEKERLQASTPLPLRENHYEQQRL